MSNCSTCAFRESISGDCHSKCNYPRIPSKERVLISMLGMVNPDELNKFTHTNFNFTVPDHALQSGYFNFPENFDPVWITGECSKHSDLTKKQIDFEDSIRASLIRHTLISVGLKEGKVVDSPIVQESLAKYTEAMDFLNKQKTIHADNVHSEAAQLVRGDFLNMLKDADEFFTAHLREDFKNIPEFSKQVF